MIFFLAALLEVGGDALIRKGLRGFGAGFIVLGVAALGSYGIVVNMTGGGIAETNQTLTRR